MMQEESILLFEESDAAFCRLYCKKLMFLLCCGEDVERFFKDPTLAVLDESSLLTMARLKILSCPLILPARRAAVSSTLDALIQHLPRLATAHRRAIFDGKDLVQRMMTTTAAHLYFASRTLDERIVGEHAFRRLDRLHENASHLFESDQVASEKKAIGQTKRLYLDLLALVLLPIPCRPSVHLDIPPLYNMLQCTHAVVELPPLYKFFYDLMQRMVSRSLLKMDPEKINKLYLSFQSTPRRTITALFTATNSTSLVNGFLALLLNPALVGGQNLLQRWVAPMVELEGIKEALKEIKALFPSSIHTRVVDCVNKTFPRDIPPYDEVALENLLRDTTLAPGKIAEAMISEALKTAESRQSLYHLFAMEIDIRHKRAFLDLLGGGPLVDFLKVLVPLFFELVHNVIGDDSLLRLFDLSFQAMEAALVAAKTRDLPDREAQISSAIASLFDALHQFFHKAAIEDREGVLLQLVHWLDNSYKLPGVDVMQLVSENLSEEEAKQFWLEVEKTRQYNFYEKKDRPNGAPPLHTMMLLIPAFRAAVLAWHGRVSVDPAPVGDSGELGPRVLVHLEVVITHGHTHSITNLQAAGLKQGDFVPGAKETSIWMRTLPYLDYVVEMPGQLDAHRYRHCRVAPISIVAVSCSDAEEEERKSHGFVCVTRPLCKILLRKRYVRLWYKRQWPSSEGGELTVVETVRVCSEKISLANDGYAKLLMSGDVRFSVWVKTVKIR